MVEPSPERLRQMAFDEVAECRRAMEQGHHDLSGLQQSVGAYCAAIARLPQEQGKLHEKDLLQLMTEIEELGADLKNARDAVRKELEGLGRLKQANVAYHTSYAIGPVTLPSEEEE